MVRSATVIGIDAEPVEIEIDLSAGLAKTIIVGLPDKAVRESRDRVQAALNNCGYRYPNAGRMTINLAPASTRKAGPMYDLPIAVGILVATGQLQSERLDDVVMVGELALDGRLRPVQGILPIAGSCRPRSLVVPWDNGSEAAILDDLEVMAARSLPEVVGYLLGDDPPPVPVLASSNLCSLDLGDVVGQPHAKYALQVAAAGGHHLMMVGPPGVGKSMLARRLPGLLGSLAPDRALETSRIYSVAGLLRGGMLRTPPFRAPHHTVSRAGLIGGGSPLQPGEVSLAHNGVLFLDEAPEFKRDLLDALRQPLEEAEVAVVRVAQRVTYPARFQLVLAMNPCPCGHFLTSPNRCRCPQRVVDRYLGRISGPLLDRIDIQIQLEAVAPAALGGQPDPSGTTQSLCEAVGQARERQHARGGLNAQLSDKLMQGAARLTEAARSCLNVCAGDQELSPRGYYRMVRLARTVADLEGSERIQPDHVLQAVMLRCSAGI